MKLLVVIVICCGIALAYNPEDDCTATDIEIGKVVGNTKAHAAALLLWSMRKILGIFLSLPITTQQHLQLTKSVTALEQKYQISQAVTRILEIFDYQINKDSNSPPIIVEENSFRALEATIDNVVNGCNKFSRCVIAASKSNTFNEFEEELVNGSGQTLYLLTYKAMVPFVSFSPNYKLKAIKTFNKLSSMLDGVLSTLEKSAFGESIRPLMQRYKTFVDETHFLFKFPTSELTSISGSNDKGIYHQFVLIKIHDVYDLEHLYNTISYVASYLETADEATISRLPLPQNMQKTIFSLDQNYSQLRTVLINVNRDLQKENTPYPGLIKRFLSAICQLEPIRFELDKQLFEILGALKKPKEDNFAPEEIIHEFVRGGLEQDGSDYDIRHDYNQNVEQIDKKMLQTWNHVVLLTRRIWRTLACQLFQIFNVVNLSYEVNGILANITQRLKFPDITSYLTEIPTISYQQIVVEFDTMNSFEKAVTEFIELLKSLNVGEKCRLPRAKQTKLDGRAQKVFSTIQRVLYQLKAVCALDKTSVLEETIKQNDGIMDLLKESSSHSNFRESIEPIVTILQTFSLDFKSLLNSHKLLSEDTEENRKKRIVLFSTADQLVGTCNFVFSTKGLVYVANFLNKIDEHADLGTLNQEGITKTQHLLESHLGKRKDVMELVETMCADETAVEKDIVDQISVVIWELNGDHIILREQIREILRALPRPSEDQTEFDEMCSAYSELIGPFELAPLNDAYVTGEQDNDVAIVENEDIGNKRMETLDSTEQWVRAVKRMRYSQSDTVVESEEVEDGADTAM